MMSLGELIGDQMTFSHLEFRIGDGDRANGCSYGHRKDPTAIFLPKKPIIKKKKGNA